ncbi:DEAD/DEAH box helicase [Fusobacterium nucleatum]|uniref:DEAD/DEAH box helicase n=1 Tax=Fusobacterium nucleatum TaxID=851 RepID=A0A3P1VV48_FUSNU|nr:DEAD/DEAH box helicase [Fusobacterium nucleatum]RRD38124.1 DEAD/DEAH box helicase [Fusobacterium nucleatum]
MENNIIDVKYSQSGKSKKTNDKGMREMQARAYEKRKSQYLLIKAPPASGKSRALMFIALDKLRKQGLKKVIVAVPEKTIGASFKNTNLKDFGFEYNWEINPRYNLTTGGTEKSKVDTFIEFLKSNEDIVICTHATLRFAYEKLANDDEFNNCLLAIDEFHHISSSENSKLGEILKNIIRNTKAHIVAMTGSYFRGDTVAILEPIDEEKFDKVTYTYYEQLDGYEYLKSFGIGFNFYQGKYISALGEVLDTNKKTIIHIPSVNSRESTKDKDNEVDEIYDLIGKHIKLDYKTGVDYIERKTDGKMLKVINLVDDDAHLRKSRVDYLSKLKSVDDLDIIIALGMAKEGFDWAWCEHALTIGYRGSLTEIVQIIGRCTRDSSNKTHAQFTNLIAQPDATQDETAYTVNTFLKAISASLLMEQVLTPDIKFKARLSPDDVSDSKALIFVKGLKEPSTERSKKIIEKDLPDLRASILSDDDVLKAMTVQNSKLINKLLIPKVIKKVYPDLEDEEIEEIREHIVADNFIKGAEFETVHSNIAGTKEFIKAGNKLVEVDKLDINLIDSVNLFQKAYAVMSRKLDVPTFKIIQRIIDEKRMDITEEEVLANAHKIKEFYNEHSKLPDINSNDEYEKRLAYIVKYLQKEKAKRENDKI